jgi:hypothetical protein
MNSRSRARADREERKTIQKQRRIERNERFATRDKVVTPYKLKSTMARKGDKSTKATHSRSKQNVELFEKAEVVSEEENPVEKGGSEVFIICKPNAICLCVFTVIRRFDKH